MVAGEHETAILLGLGLVGSDFGSVGDATAHDIVHVSVANDAARLGLAHVRSKWTPGVVVQRIVELVHPRIFRAVLVGMQLDRGPFRPCQFLESANRITSVVIYRSSNVPPAVLLAFLV